MTGLWPIRDRSLELDRQSRTLRAINLSRVRRVAGAVVMAPILGVQCFLARTALGWSVSDLARAAEVSYHTVERFERGDSVRPSSVEAIQRALDKAGIVFIDANDGGPSEHGRGEPKSLERDRRKRALHRGGGRPTRRETSEFRRWRTACEAHTKSNRQK